MGLPPVRREVGPLPLRSVAGVASTRDAPAMPHDVRLCRMPGDQRGRVSLVLDGRRVLLNFTPAEAVAVLAYVVRREDERATRGRWRRCPL